jgi:pimeloyl-ACP methyl ester carboxylesterase
VLVVSGLAGAAPSAGSPALSAVQYATVNGARFGYREGGTGSNLVMIMGRGGTMADWDPKLVGTLLPRHHIVVFDNRGVGTTNNPSTATLTIEQMAQDTLALMTKLGIDRADVMGWSMGGMIAQQVAIDAPTRVDRLVLCATSPGGVHAKTPSAAVQKALENPNLSTATLFALSFPPDKPGLRAALAYALRLKTQPNLVANSFRITSSARANQQAATAQWKSATGGSYDELPTVETPTFVLWGREDVVEPPYNNRLIAGRLPTVKTQTFGDAGHAFLFQYPVQVGRAIRSFLR